MSDRQPVLRNPTENMPAQARTRLQAKGIPVDILTGTRAEVVERIKAWAKALPRAQ